MIYWFTGQPGSGKTTLALALKQTLEARGYSVVHVDGDSLRSVTDNRDYSQVGRKKNIRVAQKLASVLQAQGFTVIVSLVSPYRRMREEFKKTETVMEVYVHTNEVRGREAYFVQDYEPPCKDFLN